MDILNIPIPEIANHLRHRIVRIIKRKLGLSS